jgi:hypothetical protein
MQAARREARRAAIREAKETLRQYGGQAYADEYGEDEDDLDEYFDSDDDDDEYDAYR